jgi:hypothetical protein
MLLTKAVTLLAFNVLRPKNKVSFSFVSLALSGLPFPDAHQRVAVLLQQSVFLLFPLSLPTQRPQIHLP